MQERLAVRRWTAAQRAEVVAAYQRGGQTQQTVAAQHGIGLSTLERWLRRSGEGPAPRRAALVEVPNPMGARPQAASYGLRFPGGLVLELSAGFDLGEVRRLAELVQSL
jgi:transposase-like protein